MCMMCLALSTRQQPFDMHVGQTFATLWEGSTDAPAEIGSGVPEIESGDIFEGNLTKNESKNLIFS